MTWSEIALIIVGILLLIVVICWIITSNSNNKSKIDEVSKTYIKNGIKFTKSEETLNDDGSTRVSLNENDIVLEKNKTHLCNKKTGILPGKYTIISSDENASTFNIRIGDLVREYKHLSSIVLSEGDEITAVSHAVILR